MDWLSGKFLNWLLELAPLRQLLAGVLAAFFLLALLIMGAALLVG